MRSYVDTGVLVKSFVLEGNSEIAIKLMERSGDPIIHSHLHAIEIPNAIHLKFFRGEITKTQEKASLDLYATDLKEGRLVFPSYDLKAVFSLSSELAAKFSPELGTRSMDILHVAAAIEIGCLKFISFDHRQQKLAALSGLEVVPKL